MDRDEEQRGTYHLRSRGSQRRLEEDSDDDDVDVVDEEEEEANDDVDEEEEEGDNDDGAPSSHQTSPAPAQRKKASTPWEEESGLTHVSSSIVTPTPTWGPKPGEPAHPKSEISHMRKQKKQIKSPFAHQVTEIIDLTNEWVRLSYCLPW